MSEPANVDYPIRWSRVAVAVAALVAILFFAWYFLIRDDDSGSVPQAGEGPVAASEDSLKELQDEVGHTIYWAGPQDDAQIEATLTEDDEVYVRYLDEDAEIGEPAADFLTIGTYPVKDAEGLVKELADQDGALTNATPDGARVVTNEDKPNSVYFADTDENLQIEIYDPDAAKAFTLATGGGIVPVP